MEKLAVVVLLFMTSWPLFAAKAPTKYESTAVLNKKIKIQNKQLKKLTGKISKVEKDLQKNNKVFVEIVSKRNEIEIISHKLHNEMEEDKKILENERKEAEKVTRGILLTRLGNEKTAVEMISDDILIKMLKKKLMNIEERLDRNKKLSNRLTKLQVEHQRFQTDENIILQKLHKLERDKQKYAHQYVSRVEKIQTFQQKLKSKKRKKEKDVGVVDLQKKVYQSPLKNFVAFDEREVDLKYVFKGSLPVFAPRDGQVIGVVKRFSHWDATLMIDHGAQDFSVIYGSFIPRVKKGMNVQRGEVIGYTDTLGKMIGELYFGIRKGIKSGRRKKFENIKASRYVQVNKQTTI